MRSPASPTLRWIEHGPSAGGWNMAIDAVLLANAAARPTLRVYGWDPPTVSLGRFQRAGDRPLDLAGLPWVRRMTGGGAILHRDELTYALALPLGLLPVPRRAIRASYRVVHAAIREALVSLGVPVDPPPDAPRRAGSGGETDSAPENSTPEVATALGLHSADPVEGSRGLPFLCYGRREGFDLTVGGRKLVGSAQRRRLDALLQHGSIPLGPVANATGGTTASLEAGSRVSFAAVAAALGEAVARALGLPLVAGTLTAQETREVRRVGLRSGGLVR